MEPDFESLVAEALAAPFHGWDFGWLHNRGEEQALPWAYHDLARREIEKAESLIDLDTGGGENLAEIGTTLTDALTLDGAVAAMKEAGFEVLDARESRPVMAFKDIAAVVYQLRAVPWQVPGFDVERYDHQLRRLHHCIRESESGEFAVHHHRLLIKVRKPL